MKNTLTYLFLFWIGIQSGTSQTYFSSEGGKYSRMLGELENTLHVDEYRTTILDGRERTIFVSWIRDHVHTMKAHKYWAKDLSSYLDFFLGRQSEKGIYYDYVMSYKTRNVGEMFFANVFDPQFFFIDVNNQNWFFRMPIEADLEYLIIEGVYTYFKSSADTAFIKKWIPAMVKGMAYEMSDALRWSPEMLLVKRPYSIDTWDFTSEPDGLTGVDRLLYHIGNSEETPKGIMHGDNTGMYQASSQLSEMYTALGMKTEADEWRLQADMFLSRVNRICWNGKFYSHFVPVDPMPDHIKSDPINSIGLSNTYSINRGSTSRAMAASIIETYMSIGEKMKDQSMAPWYGIYPFIEPDYGNYKVGEYMNGSILPLVGGELTKAAFQNGYEKYAVAQLEVLNNLLLKNSGRLHGCINYDGTPQKEAVPDVWGQAAFVSALIEGLAGVVDKGVRFSNLELSPRWIFAGVDKISVKVGYGGDGNHVSYDYSYNSVAREITLRTDCISKNIKIRLPFPDRAGRVTVLINGKATTPAIEVVNNSRYAVVNTTTGNCSVKCSFR